MLDESDGLELSVTPDPNQLDKEWCEQPRLRLRWGNELAEAKQAVSQSKAELELTEAELDQDIRSNPKKYGLEKVTETSIRNAMVLQASYKEAQNRLIKCQHAVDVVQAVVSAIEHKKSALEELVRLRLADYYSECKAPDEARGEMEEVVKMSVRSRRIRDE